MIRHTILAVIPPGDDRTFLTCACETPQWKLHCIWGFEEASFFVHLSSPAVVLSEARLPDRRGWKDLLGELQGIVNAPPLIVTDRHADEHLWAEVLNLGAYDLLMRPFQKDELLRVLSHACHAYEHRKALPAVQYKPIQPDTDLRWITKRAAAG